MDYGSGMGRGMGWMAAVVFCLGLVVSPDLGLARTLNVPSVGNSTIQSAINHAVNGDTVLVEAGRYKGNIIFTGKAITVRSKYGATKTVIDGNYNNSGSVVIFANSELHSTKLDGFTIVNGNLGGINCNSSSPTITNCTISNNSISSYGNYGGGIACVSSSPIISNCTISNNIARDGGGIACWKSSPTITNCTIGSNSASYDGGGISCWDGSAPTITKCTIRYNRLHSQPILGGGGIYCNKSLPSISNCIISNNLTSCNGGGIYYYESSPTIINCIISNNLARCNGGGIYCDNSSPTIKNCTVSNNLTSFNGGGIDCSGDLTGFSAASPTITNCVIVGNLAGTKNGGEGGGIHCWSSSNPNITNCTISSNSARYGGGIACGDSSKPVIKNSILWGDRSLNGSEVSKDAASTITSAISITYSDIQQAGYAGSNGNIYSNPKFVSAARGDFHLKAGSPCIDTGIASYKGIKAPATDKDGNPRPDVPNTNPDMGAYEWGQCPPPAAPASISYPAKSCNIGRGVKLHKTFIVNWPSVQGAVSYTLQRATKSSFSNAVTVYSGSNTPYQETSLPIGVYYYRVRAANNCGNSVWENGHSVKIVRCLP